MMKKAINPAFFYLFSSPRVSKALLFGSRMENDPQERELDQVIIQCSSFAIREVVVEVFRHAKSELLTNKRFVLTGVVLCTIVFLLILSTHQTMVYTDVESPIYGLLQTTVFMQYTFFVVLCSMIAVPVMFVLCDEYVTTPIATCFELLQNTVRPRR